MKRFLLACLLFSISFTTFSQTASESARAAALRAAMQSGQKAPIQNTINFVDEIRKEVGGNWDWNTITDNDDTVTVFSVPGDAYTADQTLYRVRFVFKLTVTNDTTTSKIFIGYNAAKDSITITAKLNPIVEYDAYLFREGSTYRWKAVYEITTTESGNTTKHFTEGTFTKTASTPTPIKFWPTGASEVTSYKMTAIAQLLRK